MKSQHRPGRARDVAGKVHLSERRIVRRRIIQHITNICAEDQCVLAMSPCEVVGKLIRPAVIEVGGRQIVSHAEISGDVQKRESFFVRIQWPAVRSADLEAVDPKRLDGKVCSGPRAQLFYVLKI